MKEGMGIQTISTLYDTMHYINHTAMRLKGDKIVNAALDSAVTRESEFTRKQSTVVRAQKVQDWAMSKNSVDTEMSSFPGALGTKEAAKLTEQIKKKLCER